MVQLAKGLRWATRLRVLDLHYEKRGPSIATIGVTALALALRHLSRLESLNCEGMRAFMRAMNICTMCPCTRFACFLGALAPGVDGANQLALGVQGAASLTWLNLKRTTKHGFAGSMTQFPVTSLFRS